MAADASPSAVTRRRNEIALLASVALFLLVVMPLLHATGGISTFTITLWGKYLCYALLAMSVNLLWGYTGLLSLGQALFFTLGGYMHGMYLMRMIGDLGQYHKPIPDFLVFLGWTKLPAFWEPFANFPFALAMVFLVPGVVAYFFGYLAFRSRIRGVYFSILTQALTYAASILFFRNNLLLGGNNGFTDFKFILGHSLVDKDAGPVTLRGLYIATALAVVAVYLLSRWLNQTKFGLVQQAIRDGENRVLFSGYATTHYKLFVFVLAAWIAALGGALFVPQAGIINPEEMKAQNSVEAVVWVAVGGRGTLIGPIIGAISINVLKSWASRAFPDSWLIILGVLCILVVLFLPGGLVSLPERLKALWSKWSAPAPAGEGNEIKTAKAGKTEGLKG
ncbi:MAG TPA: urea ABC transporter permease subunit UrtC [Lacunisphaera sp.]|nr:urea ABC transporter permease subunit UrtC [Lacunisphaera sp.]